jgi:DNA polymerase III alpha subunit
MNKNILPIFSSHFSLGKSTLTLEKPEPIEDNKPISIFSIAKENKLTEIYLVENNFSGFIQAYKTSKDNKINLKFGLKLVICNDLADKSEASFKTESKVIIWMKNSDAYKDLIRIYSKAATDGFYYLPRLDWKHLQEMFTNNLILSIPSYGSFLHNNLLKGYECVPDFGKLKYNIMYSRMSLPFDFLIEENHKNYAKNNNIEILETHPIYFYSLKQLDSYICFKAIHKRGQFSAPKIDNHGSSDFCWENYKNK